jgi:hypothetical protein
MDTNKTKKIFRPTFSPREKVTYYIHPMLAKRIKALARGTLTLSNVAEQLIQRGLGWKTGRSYRD